MRRALGVLLLVMVACGGGGATTHTPDAFVEADANGAWARTAIASLAPRLADAEARWRQTAPVAGFDGLVALDVGADGAIVAARPVRPLGDGAFAFALEALDGARVTPPDGKRAVRLALPVRFAAPPEERPVRPAGPTAKPLTEAEQKAKELHDDHVAECNGGDTFQCVNAGYDLQKGLGCAVDEAQAAVFYTRACDTKTRDGAEGCADLGWLMEMGFGVPKDEPKAAKLYRLGCDLGAKLGCNNLGVMNRDGRGGFSKDFPTAQKLFQQACDMQDWAGCANLGYMLARGEGGPKNIKRAIELYTTACNHDNAYGCHNLGYRYELGDGVAKDEAKAAQLYVKACNGGEMPGCVAAGNSYETGAGVSTSARTASGYYLKACDAQNGEGCARLADMYVRGYGLDVPRDDAKALEYAKRGCALHDASACSLATQLGNTP